MVENERLGYQTDIGLRMALPLTDYVKLSRKHNDLPGPGTRYAGVDWW